MSLLIVLASSAAIAARADEAARSPFSFSAFGTLGAVHSSEDRADFTLSFLKPNGAGFTHRWSTDVDSRLGVQVIARATPRLSAVVQVIAEQLFDNTYRPHVEWANIKYQVTPELSLRIGRTVLPSLMFADTRKVSYAIPWVRPPVELYGENPVPISDGVDGSYAIELGGFANRFTATYGRISQRLVPNSPGSTFDARDLWLLSDTLEYRGASVRVAYEHTHLRLPGFKPLFAALSSFGPEGSALAERYTLEGKSTTYLAAGAQYDPGDWFAMGEWTRTDYDSALGTSTAWYLSTGYHWRKLTPYVTYSRLKPNSTAADPPLTLSRLPAPLVGPAIGVNSELEALQRSIAPQKTLSVGMRWDFIRNADFKVQYDRVRLGPGSRGTLINLQPDFPLGSTVNLFSVAVDFVL